MTVAEKRLPAFPGLIFSAVSVKWCPTKGGKDE
jgi:hypothetical protein